VSTFTFRQAAPEGHLFGSTVPEEILGDEVPVQVDGVTVATARIVGAEVVEDGAALHIRLSDAPDFFLGAIEGLSVGLPEEVADGQGA